MSGITKEDFSEIYKEQFLPKLKILETERIKLNEKLQPYYAILVVSIIATFMGMLPLLGIFLPFGTAGIILTQYFISKYKNKIRKDLKDEIITKILSTYNFYRSDSSNIVSSSEIKDMGLFPLFTTKVNDDIIIGIHKGCNFAINECHLTHTEQRGKHSVTITDFRGLIVKIQMNKTFTGKTIVGRKGKIKKKKGFDTVELEDTNFNKKLNVYSTDQIEARYLLTTTNMERLYELGKTFIGRRALTKKEAQIQLDTGTTQVSAAFIDGYMYLFIPSFEDFFEININTSLLDETKYFDIYCQLQLILSIIDYFKLDTKLGL